MIALACFGCGESQQPADSTSDEPASEASSGTNGPATTPPGTGSSDASTTTADGPDTTSSASGPTEGTTGDPQTDAGSTTAQASTGTQAETTTSDSTESGVQDDSSTGEPVVYEPFDYDGFDDPAGLDNWYLRDEWEGTPAQYTTLDFDTTTPGAMTMVPTTSGWFGEYDGPFVFKLVSGDFIIETSVVVTGRLDPSGPPTQTYNSAGLMLRDPANEPMGENWVIHNTGFQESEVASEGKITIDSVSILVTTPGSLVGRLRICRVGGQIAVARYLEGDSGWIDTTTPYPDLLPDEVQAGMAVTAWNSTGNTPNWNEDPDMIAIWDYVAFYDIDDMSRCYEG